MRSLVRFVLGCLVVACVGAAAFGESYITVAGDGSGDYTTVQAAVDAVPAGNTERCIINIAPGSYYGRVIIPSNKPYITLRGVDPSSTVITCDEWAGTPPNESYVHATAVMLAADCIAEGVTFANTHGASGQALAIYAKADRLVFNNCQFTGWQDTLRSERYRHYFVNSYVEGSVDFIYGQGQAYFDDCEIYSKAGGHVTAQGRESASASDGYVFHDCTLTGSAGDDSVYLGRAWQPYARVVYDSCYMGTHIDPDGWTHWNDIEYDPSTSSAFFAECNSTGPGADPSSRVAWSHQLVADPNSPLSVEPFTLANWLGGGDSWDPTGDVAAAATIRWGLATGDWSATGNWTPSGTPTSADVVDITGGTAQVTTAGNQADSVYVANSSSAGGQLTVSGGLTVGGDVVIGNVRAAHGRLVAAGGTMSVGGQISLAPDEGSAGTLTVAKGAYVQAGLTIAGGGGRTARLNVQVASDGNSVVHTTGASALAGELDVQSLGGYRPREGDAFTIIDCSDPNAACTGGFTSITSDIAIGLQTGLDAFAARASGEDYQIVFQGLTSGDASGSHAVDGGDLALMGGNWMDTSGTLGWADGDFNGDGNVDGGDLALMGGNWMWTMPAPPPAAVPEPASACLIVFGAAALLRRGRSAWGHSPGVIV